MSRSQPLDALKAGGRAATESGGRLRAREWLVGFEVALSTVLLVVAALLGVSFLRLTGVERGFEVDRVLTATVNLPASRYPADEQKKLFHQRMVEKLESLPGVKRAALVSALPLAGESWGDLVNKEGETRPIMQRPTANFRFISSHYFEAMGIALRAGRAPTEADRSHKVAVISESVARKAWPNEDALGKRIKRTDDPAAASCEVVGVVADVRTVSLEKQPPLMVYVPYWDGAYWQGGVRGDASYVLRTSQDASGMANAFRGAVRSLDPELPLAGVRTMGEVLGESVGRRRFQTSLAGVFAVSALLLACLGIYGVISYSVTRRTNEMGVRMALGAPAAGLALMVLRQGMKPVVAGLGVGVLGALWAGQLLGSLLFGVSARDPATISAVVVLLLGVAALACWGPARRASRVDPLVALHYE
jgi:putative ABC transport system permease protein